MVLGTAFCGLEGLKEHRLDTGDRANHCAWKERPVHDRVQGRRAVAEGPCQAGLREGQIWRFRVRHGWQCEPHV